MNITGEILSCSAKGLKTTVKGFAARLGEKIGIVQKEVQECAGKSAQEIAEMTSKKDVAQVAAKNAENATAQTNKKLSIAERFKNFKAKLSDKLTNKIHVKDKSKMIETKSPFGHDVKIAPGIHQEAIPDGRYITSTADVELTWKPSKNPIKRFLGLNDIEHARLKKDGTYYYRKNGKYFQKVTEIRTVVEGSNGWKYDGKYSTDYSLTRWLPLKVRYYARPLP